MDFFASQELARRKSKLLIFLFFVAVIIMIVAIYLVVALVLGITNNSTASLGETQFSILNLPLLLIVSTFVSFVVGGGSLYKIAQLRGGGSVVAASLGGRRLPPSTRDPGERRLLNVVEEMALASGTPVPPVYVLENEPGINAFAAGYSVDDAVIGVNRGTVDQLNRDELQGVIAHEFSHILNGDMRMSIRMMGILHGIQLLALIGYFLLRTGSYSSGRSSNNKGGGAYIILIAIGVLVVGSIGLFFARVIKASLSRQREYLADSSAVQFTRNPEGLAGALKMIGANEYGSQVLSPSAEIASHMYFGSMFAHGGLLSTHPPLLKRIQKLDKRFQGDFDAYLKERSKRTPEQDRAREQKRQEKLKSQFPGGRFPIGFGDRMLPDQIASHFPLDPAILIAGIGTPTEDDVEYSQMVVNHVPESLATASRDVFSSRCIVLAMLLETDGTVRGQQLSLIEQREGPPTIEETLRLEPLLRELQMALRLPVFEILQGTLSGMSAEQYQLYRGTVTSMVEADRRVNLFEFFLKHHLLVHLDRYYGLLSPSVIRYKNIDAVQNEVRVLLSILANVGHEDQLVAAQAFAAASQSISPAWPTEIMSSQELSSYSLLENALERLGMATPQVKKQTLSAAAILITFDREVTILEAELFRAMSESLDCPVPPIVATTGQSPGPQV